VEKKNPAEGGARQARPGTRWGRESPVRYRRGTGRARVRRLDPPAYRLWWVCLGSEHFHSVRLLPKRARISQTSFSWMTRALSSSAHSENTSLVRCREPVDRLPERLQERGRHVSEPGVEGEEIEEAIPQHGGGAGLCRPCAGPVGYPA
jgi:hypothetical protein